MDCIEAMDCCYRMRHIYSSLFLLLVMKKVKYVIEVIEEMLSYVPLYFAVSSFYIPNGE